MNTIIVIDGNDGTGKSTLVASLKKLGLDVQDRGVPTKMTDNDSVHARPGELYLILDVPVEVSRERLAKAGRDLNEQYHTVEDLTYYRQRFLEVAEFLGSSARLVDAQGSSEEVLAECLRIIKEIDLVLFFDLNG